MGRVIAVGRARDISELQKVIFSPFRILTWPLMMVLNNPCPVYRTVTLIRLFKLMGFCFLTYVMKITIHLKQCMQSS